MQESFKLRISLERQQNLQIYPLQEIAIEDVVNVPLSLILRKVNDYIRDEKIQIEQFLNIWVVTKNSRQNIYKLKKKKIQLRIMANEEGHFELNIVLEIVGQKGNILRNFQHHSDQYVRLDNNINKIVEESKFEQEKNGQRAIRPIDIAYFFADPLVSVSSIKNEPKAIFEVSYQKQYDKFIEMVSKEALDNNLKIQMMVATETNIKNTLIDGVSIMHFACHGKNIVGNLQIESERPVGELVDFQHKRFKNLLEKKTLPKLIIFNVCYSSTLAKMITEEKKIMTIGYDNEANDDYCEYFTREFYQGIFENKKSVRELFEKIKQDITAKNEVEGKKLKLYPETPFEDENSEPLFASIEQNINWVQKWNLLENMREKDPVGVKKQMHKFIKDCLTHTDRLEYLFLTGEPSSGKSLFMNKTRIYVMNRKVFNENIVIDLKNQSGMVQMDSMLRFKLNKQWLIDQKLAQFKEIGKGATVRPLIIFDHFQKIIKYEFKKLIDYIDNKFFSRLKYGKIIIVTNNIEPIVEEERKIYKGAKKHKKEKPQLEDKQLKNLVNRYTQMKWDKTLMDSVAMIKKQRDYSPISIVQALKKSEKPEHFEPNYQFFLENHKKKLLKLNEQPQKAIQTIVRQINQLESEINQQAQFVNVRIEQNDYIYLSTIFQEVALHKLSTYNLQLKKTTSDNLSNRPLDGSNIKRLVCKIKVFLKSALRYYAAQFIGLIKFFIHISLKLATICYFHGEFDMFQQHLLNCQKFHVKMLAVYSQQLKKSKANQGEMEIQIQSLLRTFHLKILLSLYSYYSQNKFKLQAKQRRSSEENDKIFSFTKKTEVVLDELLKEFAKKEFANVNQFIKNLHKINFIAQELHYRSEYKFLMHENTRARKQSDAYDCANEQPNYFEIARKIDDHHRKIVEYWKSYKKLQDFYNSSTELSKDSLLLILLIIIKLIFFNISEMEQMMSKGDSFLKLKRIQYINQYIEIMDKIYCEGIFTNKVNKQSIFVYQEHECIRLLFKTYLKNYIIVSFQLEKYKQDITKDYNIRRYNELINLCDLSSSITTLSSIKKTIEMHISEQFFNTWSVKTFISCPLILEQSGREIRCNIKRYQQHIFKFQHILFKHELDKQVNFQISLMNYQSLANQQELCRNSNKNLIYLIVCDFKVNESKTDSDKILMQSETGEIMYEKINSSWYPQAPIIIVFGVNADRLVAQYHDRQSDSIVISINIRHFYTENDFQRQKVQKQKKINNTLEDYASKLEIYYVILQYFYCSFCRHFFNAEHKLFIEQVRSSFHLAKAEALIKTKIRYYGVKFNQGDIIEDIIRDIDFNLPYLQGATFASDIKTRPAYQFIYKQRRPNKNLQNCRYYKILNEIRSEIGCNLQLRELLTLISKKRDEHMCVFYFYKSDDLKDSFLRSLKMKLSKQNLFSIEKAIIGEADYEDYRKSLKKKLKSLNEDHFDSGEQAFREVQFFLNLTNEQMLAEKQSQDRLKKTKTVKIFFSKHSFSKQLTPSFAIEESYPRNRIQFELFFLQQMNIRNFRNDLNPKKFQAIYRKIFDNNQVKFQSIKKDMEKQRSRQSY